MPGWDPPEDNTFPRDVAHGLQGVFQGAAGDAIDRFKLPIDFDWTLPQAVNYGAARGAELVGKKLVDGKLVDNPNAEWAIDDWTRERVREIEAKALNEGLSIDQFSDLLQESGLFGEARSDMVARTELGLSMAAGKAQVYREVGFDYVYVYDGDGDEECEALNGTIQTLEWFEENPLGHPNCLRDARPATQEELIEEGIIDAEDVRAEADEEREAA